MSQSANTKTEIKDVKKVTDLKLVETPKTTEEVKKTVPTEDKKPLLEKEVLSLLNPSSETRLKSLSLFQVLAEKYKMLKDMEDNLNKFRISSDGSKEKIELSNNSGYSLKLTNTQTIEKVLDVLQNELNVFIERADQEIKSFVI